jgi:hypothetical protein
VQRPGDLDSRAAQFAQGMIADAMPFVVGKKVAPPDGTTVVFHVTGALPRDIAIVVEGSRAKLLDDVPAQPTARLTMDSVCFERVACGRVNPSLVLEAGEVRLDGDVDLARQVAVEMNYMF